MAQENNSACTELELRKAKAQTEQAYEFLEILEAKTWCKTTQMDIQDFLRKTGHWPELQKTQEEAVL